MSRRRPLRLWLLALAAGAAPAAAQAPFGRVSLAPDLALDGAGTDVDSIAFWEAPDPADTLLLVSAKGNQRVEVWRFPFVAGEQAPLVHASFGAKTRVNGLAVDPRTDRLYVSVSSPRSTVSRFSLPAQRFEGELVAGAVDLGSEPNLALLHRPSGASWLYVSADDVVYVRDAASGAAVAEFRPAAGVETLAADDRDQVIYAPDENGRSGVLAYTPLGAPHRRGGTNRFGAGVFEADAEGILVYRCLAGGAVDTGAGWIVVADQRPDHTDFEFFDRRSWRHLGALELAGVANTDGIGSTQRALPGFAQGLFAAIDDDSRAVAVGWQRIFAATGLACPAAPGPPVPGPAARPPLAPHPLRHGAGRRSLAP